MSSPTPPAPTPNPHPDWATQAADAVERIVYQVRDRTTRPVIVLARGVVFGLLGLIVGIAVLTMLWIALVRALSFIPPDVWVAHLIVAVVFLIVGTVLMVKRKAPATGPAEA